MLKCPRCAWGRCVLYAGLVLAAGRMEAILAGRKFLCHLSYPAVPQRGELGSHCSNCWKPLTEGEKEREKEGDITHESLVGECCEHVHQISFFLKALLEEILPWILKWVCLMPISHFILQHISLRKLLLIIKNYYIKLLYKKYIQLWTQCKLIWKIKTWLICCEDVNTRVLRVQRKCLPMCFKVDFENIFPFLYYEHFCILLTQIVATYCMKLEFQLCLEKSILSSQILPCRAKVILAVCL